MLKPKPFLKWAGGKTQLLPEIIKHIPDNIEIYFEPFLGGGAVFFELYNRKKFKSAVLSDVNLELILTWRAIQKHVEYVIASLHQKINTPEFFYQEREKDIGMMLPYAVASRMIYLNKACFNGLYRVNKSGKFNVPFGRYKTLPIYKKSYEELLEAVVASLKNVHIVHCDFEKGEQWICDDSFLFFDPPYVPLTQTANFTSYSKEGFTMKDQERLAAFMFRLKEKKIKALLSNSDCKATRTLYDGLNIFTVDAHRNINRDGNGRGKVTELLVRTY